MHLTAYVLPLLASLPVDRAWTGPIVHPPVAEDLVPVVEEVQAAGLAVPEDARVLYVLRGGEQEHLGISACVVGDLDGDGARDFVLGGLYCAYFAYGPGGARAYSSRTGRRLWEVHGTRNGGTPSKGDAFGSAVCVTGDVDGDKVTDVAIGGWRFASNRGLVRIVSGKDGRVLASLHGPTRDDKPVVVHGSETTLDDVREVSTQISGFGGFLEATGDLDKDGAADFLIGEDLNGSSRCWAISSKSLRVLYRCKSIPPAMTRDLDAVGVARVCGDLDRDGRSETLMPLLWIGGRMRVEIRSGAGGEAIHTLESSGRTFGLRHALLYDLTGDGKPELLITEYEASKPLGCRGRAWVIAFP